MPTATAAPVDANGQPDIAKWPYSFAILRLDQLVVDAYQRPLTNFVDKIEQQYNPALVGTLCVSERSRTKFAVIDGQTRAEGMRRRGEKVAPCLVYHGLTREAEAALFALFQTERRGMTSANRFNAQVVAKDKTALAILEVLEGLDFSIGSSNAGSQIAAVAAVEFVFHGAKAGEAAKAISDPELLAKTLETIRGAWPKLPDLAKSATMIKGLGFYLNNQGKDATLEKLALKLSKVQPSSLIDRANKLREGRGVTASSPAHLAEAIENVYRQR